MKLREIFETNGLDMDDALGLLHDRIHPVSGRLLSARPVHQEGPMKHYEPKAAEHEWAEGVADDIISILEDYGYLRGCDNDRERMLLVRKLVLRHCAPRESAETVRNSPPPVKREAL